MENTNNNTAAPALGMLQFANPKGESSYIKVIGVGGGGGNAVNHMYRNGIEGVDFVVTNTDTKALMSSPVPKKIVLAELGAGGNPEVARMFAEQRVDEIRNAISNRTKMLFITAGMGGGTGTGAAPVIARIAKEIDLEDPVVKKILVVAVVTMPFFFEGKKRRDQALQGVKELGEHVDSILVINNDKIRELHGNLTLTDGFSKADDVLLDAVKGIAEIITRSDKVSVDFNDVNSVMQQSGTALMGTGIGHGQTRAMDAIKAASESVLLNDNNISGAKNALLYFSFHPDHEITFDEIGEVTDYMRGLIGDSDANIIWGTGKDDTLGDDLKITLIATGYEQKKAIRSSFDEEERRVLPFDKKPEPEAKPEAQAETQAETVPESRKVYTLEPEPEPEAKVVAEPEPVAEAPKDALESKLDDIFANMTLRVHAPVPEPVAEPVAVVKPEPVAVVEPEPAAVVEPEPIVITEPVVVAKPIAEPVVVAKPEPAASVVYAHEQQPDPIFQPRSHGNADSNVDERAERIRRMNMLLHGTPEEALAVERMGVDELQRGAFSMGITSSRPENKTRIDANGRITTSRNNLFDLPD